jgi:hypothetical protein
MGATGLVTFVFNPSPAIIARHTLLFVRQGGQWKLAHMDASNAELAAP